MSYKNIQPIFPTTARPQPPHSIVHRRAVAVVEKRTFSVFAIALVAVRETRVRARLFVFGLFADRGRTVAGALLFRFIM